MAEGSRGELGRVVSQFRGDRGERRVGSGVDEQFARRRTLWLSAVGATLPLHRRGRDKLGVEDAARRRKGKWWCRVRRAGGIRRRIQGRGGCES